MVIKMAPSRKLNIPQTRSLQQPIEFIYMIYKHVERSVLFWFRFEVKVLTHFRVFSRLGHSGFSYCYAKLMDYYMFAVKCLIYIYGVLFQCLSIEKWWYNNIWMFWGILRIVCIYLGEERETLIHVYVWQKIDSLVYITAWWMFTKLCRAEVLKTQIYV